MSHQKQVNDKVLCSAGRGEISKEDCLKCALAGNNACGFGHALLNALYKDKERTGIHVTDLTGCIRQAYYNKKIGALEHPHEMLNRFIGTAVHEHIEKYPSEEFDSEMPLSALGLVGTADAVYKCGHIVDFKTTRWMKLNKLPYGSHVEQLNIYAALLREMGKPVTSAAIQYIDLSGPSKCTTCKGPTKPNEDAIMVCTRCGRHLPLAHPGVALVEVPLEEQSVVAELVNTRRKLLEMSLEEEKVPDPEPSYLCDYCPFLERCKNE